jgi:hypothetical protein
VPTVVGPAASSAPPLVTPAILDAAVEEAASPGVAPSTSETPAPASAASSARPPPVEPPGHAVVHTLPETYPATWPAEAGPSSSASSTAGSIAPGDGGAGGNPGAHVVLGTVTANRASPADVLAVLPVDRFAACYRDALRANGKLARGSAALHLDIDPDGQIAKASFEGTEAMRDLGDCIVHAALGHRVRGVQGGAGADAEVPLSFRGE